MDIKEIHDFIDFILQKERGAFLSPEESDMLLNRAQWWFYNEEFSFYAKDQKIKDSLAVFSTKFQFVASSTGIVQLPIDFEAKPCYQHLLSMSTQYYDNRAQRIRYKPIKFLNEDEIAERLDSQILAPSTTHPVGEELAPGLFQLYPKLALGGTGYYLRNPATPVFSYSIDEDERTIVYDAGDSEQLEWDESSKNKIIIKALQLAGVNIGDQMIIQYTELKNQQDI